MTLEFQKRLAADLMKCGITRVRFDPERLDEIESAIERSEIRKLIRDGAIQKIQAKGVSRGRRDKRHRQGSRKGAKYSIIPRKRRWIVRVRAQRAYLKRLRDRGILDRTSYRQIYSYVKAGNFKSVAALKEFIKSKGMFKTVME